MSLDISDEELAELIEETKHSSPQELLVAAWNSIQESPNSELLRESLEAAASQMPDLKDTLDYLLRPKQGVLDLSISGEKIVDHTATASEFGALVKHVADSVREIAKSISGTVRLQNRLLITAAMPGSVRVIFSVPPNQRPTVPITQSDDEAEALETFALNRLVVLLDQAENVNSLLDQTVQGLRAPARKATRALAKSLTKNEWILKGELRLPSGQKALVKLTPTGSSRLLDALQERPIRHEVFISTGYVDTWTWSSRSMVFQPDTGRKFEALVEPQEEEVVAIYHSRREFPVKATFDVLLVSLAGDSDMVRRSYKLVAIEPKVIEPSIFE